MRRYLLRSTILALALCAPTMAHAQPIAIPLCPIEGPDVFGKPASVTAINCQPSHPGEVLFAQCWTRSPDVLIPAYLTQCHCFADGSTLEPGHVPGNYAIASSGPCAPGVAVVLTSNVAFRSWGVDGGCDDAGPLCTPSGTPLDAVIAATGFGPLPFMRTRPAIHCRKCHVRHDGTQVCHAARCRQSR